MTAFAFIMGVIPLMLASGLGRGLASVMGTAVFFGMAIATLLGVFLVPFLYSSVMRLVGRRAAPAHAVPPAAAAAAHGGAAGH
jgi:hydrophobic/amphiphilic exporter-1 (mainly G- bacteria), HAE1 family